MTKTINLGGLKIKLYETEKTTRKYLRATFIMFDQFPWESVYAYMVTGLLGARGDTMKYWPADRKAEWEKAALEYENLPKEQKNQFTRDTTDWLLRGE